jgi:hypothetical protein
MQRNDPSRLRRLARNFQNARLSLCAEYHHLALANTPYPTIRSD